MKTTRRMFDEVQLVDYELRLVDLLRTGRARVTRFEEEHDIDGFTSINIELRALHVSSPRTAATREASIRHMYRALYDETPGATPFEIFERASVLFMELAAKERDREAGKDARP